MKQPELGKKINEIRNQKGITQKELADACMMDIRTIQRIESGEVVPRMSSLKLISDILEVELCSYNEIVQSPGNAFISKILLVTLITGVIELINWFLFAAIVVPINNMYTLMSLIFIIIYISGGVLYNYGFYELGKYQENKIIQFTSLVSMITVPSFYITFFIDQSNHLLFLNKICMIISIINGIIFGIGLLKSKSQFVILYRISGILQILICPFFLIHIQSIKIIVSWLAIPSIISLLVIVFYEYKNSTDSNHLLLSE